MRGVKTMKIEMMWVATQDGYQGEELMTTGDTLMEAADKMLIAIENSKACEYQMAVQYEAEQKLTALSLEQEQ